MTTPDQPADDTPLFDSVGDGAYEPTVYTRGPWNPALLHGGPVAALFAEVLQAEGGDDTQPVRLTVDLVRPVPLAPLTMKTALVRSGKRFEVLAGDLFASDKLVARATLAAIRPAPLETAAYSPPLPRTPDEPGDAASGWAPPASSESFVGGAMDFVFARQVGLGHGIAWLRLRRPVLADLPISPLARAAAAADVGNAVSSRKEPPLPPVSFVNADLSLSLSRLPEGEWIRLESVGRWEPTGIGWVRSQMSDQRSELGAVSNALVLEPMTGGFGWQEGG